VERTELTGAEGSPLTIGNAAFAVNVTMMGPEHEEFSVVDHSQESAGALPAPKAPFRGPWPRPK
jgi:hypothetical protein